MSQIYLIRHCQTSGQAPDAPLTPTGLAQAVELAEKLSNVPFKRIVSSDYLRAMQSAEPLAKACGVTIETDQRLRERNLGATPEDWQGALSKTFSEIDLAFPGGESTRVATVRAMASITEVLTSTLKPVALVTHGNLLALIAQSFDHSLGFEFWKELRNPDVFVLRADNVIGLRLVRIALV